MPPSKQRINSLNVARSDQHSTDVAVTQQINWKYNPNSEVNEMDSQTRNIHRFNTYGRRAFSAAGPTAWDCLPGTRPSVQTVSDVCLKRTYSLNTSAFSTLEVLDDNRALYIY